MSDLHGASAVAERLIWRTELFEHGEQQVRERSLRSDLDVPAALELPRRATREQDSETPLRVTPTAGGAVISLGGSF